MLLVFLVVVEHKFDWAFRAESFSKHEARERNERREKAVIPAIPLLRHLALENLVIIGLLQPHIDCLNVQRLNNFYQAVNLGVTLLLGYTCPHTV